MLDHTQEKCVVDQLKSKLVDLYTQQESWTRQMAAFGSRLKSCLDEIDEIESVLSEFEGDEDDEE